MYAGRHASSLAVTDSTAGLNNTLSPVGREAFVDKFDVGLFFKYHADEIELNGEDEAKYTFYIAEEKLHECPRIVVRIGGEEVSAILDTRCELTLMNEDLYERMKQRGDQYLELPAHLTLVSAFNDKSRRVKRQIFVPVKLGTVVIDHVFLVSQLLTLAILGVDFFYKYLRNYRFSREMCPI